MDCVRRIRKELGWSQERTAAEAGIDRVTLVHVETGKTSPTVETLRKLAGALGVEVAAFFPRTQETLFPLDAFPAGQDLTEPTGGAGVRRTLEGWTGAVRDRAEEARFRWRREVAELERPEQHLAVALTLHRAVRAEARAFFQEILKLMRALDREVPMEAPEWKVELALLATALKETSDAVRDRMQALIDELEARRRADIEELREIVKIEFGVDLEVEQEGDRLEAEEAEATLHRIEELRARRAG
jgi:transcriptional regulator with XRE-family HTH domain